MSEGSVDSSLTTKELLELAKAQNSLMAVTKNLQVEKQKQTLVRVHSKRRRGEVGGHESLRERHGRCVNAAELIC